MSAWSWLQYNHCEKNVIDITSYMYAHHTLCHDTMKKTLWF